MIIERTKAELIDSSPYNGMMVPLIDNDYKGVGMKFKMVGISESCLLSYAVEDTYPNYESFVVLGDKVQIFLP